MPLLGKSRPPPLMKPLGDRRYAFYPSGRFGPGYVIEEKDREWALKCLYGALDWYLLVCVASLLVLLWLFPNFIFGFGLLLYSAVVPAGSFLVRRACFARLPKAASMPSSEEWFEHRSQTTSNRDLVLWFVILSLVAVAGGHLIVSGHESNEVSLLVLGVLAVGFALWQSPSYIRLAAERWSHGHRR